MNTVLVNKLKIAKEGGKLWFILHKALCDSVSYVKRLKAASVPLIS